MTRYSSFVAEKIRTGLSLGGDKPVQLGEFIL
jgi:hypothetical protein